MTTLSQSEFARQQGWNRSTVTRHKQAGRLVMTGDRVEVEASLARLAETRDPNRDDVAARHAAARGVAEAPPAPPDTEAPAAAEDGLGHSYQAARAMKERYAALTAKADYERAIGQLLVRGEVEMALDDLVAVVRAGVENLPHRIAAQLVGKDYDAILATLRQEVVGLMADMHRDAQRKLAELTPGEGA